MPKDLRGVEIVKNGLDELQSAYLNAEGETEFMQLHIEATEIDGIDRVAAKITNWTRE